MKLKEVFKSVTYKDKFLTNHPDGKSNEKVEQNIYENNITKKQLVKKFVWIHYFFKYKLFVPSIYLLEKIMGKHLVNKIPDEAYNLNAKLFDEAYEKTIYDWFTLYLQPKKTRKLTDEEVIKAINYTSNGSITSLRIMKRLVLTMWMYDTAYREFGNILMNNIAETMHKEYADKNKYPNGVGHLFYTQKDGYDVYYKYVFRQAQTNITFSLVDALKEAEQDYLKQHLEGVKQ